MRTEYDTRKHRKHHYGTALVEGNGYLTIGGNDKPMYLWDVDVSKGGKHVLSTFYVGEWDERKVNREVSASARLCLDAREIEAARGGMFPDAIVDGLIG